MPQSDQSSNKSTLRRAILQQRQSLSTTEWQVKSKQICDRLQTSNLFQDAGTILAYFSFRQEPDLSPLFNLAHKQWAFPCCVGKSLVWHAWKPGIALEIGKYGIQHPTKNSAIIDPATADLILVPTVACDDQGYRLGYGGGFYDRLLSCDPLRTSKAQGDFPVPTIGIVFDFAYGIQLATDPWDMPLNFVCTETKFVGFC